MPRLYKALAPLIALSVVAGFQLLPLASPPDSLADHKGACVNDTKEACCGGHDSLFVALGLHLDPQADPQDEMHPGHEHQIPVDSNRLPAHP